MSGSREDEGPRLEDLDDIAPPRPRRQLTPIEQVAQMANAVHNIPRSHLLATVAFICSMNDDTYKNFMNNYSFINPYSPHQNIAELMGDRYSEQHFGHMIPVLRDLSRYGDTLTRLVSIYKSKQQELTALIEQESHSTQSGGFRKRRNSKYARQQHKRKSKKNKTRKNVRRRYLK